ncbi:MAG: hypothetical protein Q8K82_25885 [Gemmatimonadaceae bacterium]|nr:hypothetical protein [Gemmatimonadaceae bacterium]
MSARNAYMLAAAIMSERNVPTDRSERNVPTDRSIGFTGSP